AITSMSACRRRSHRTPNGPVADKSPLTVQVLAVCSRPGHRWTCDEAAQGDQPVITFHQDALIHKFDTENIAQALRHIPGTPMPLRLVIVKKAEGDVRVSKRDALERVKAMAVFGCL